MDRRALLGMMGLAAFADFQVPGATQSAGPAAAPDRTTSTPAAIRAPFVGLYKLVIYKSHGANPIGRIEYDAAGRMWALLHPPGRTPLPRTSPTIDDYRQMNRGMVAYYGAFDVDRAAMTVTHHVQAASNPAWIGTDFVRWYKFGGNRLTLALDKDFANVLVWERLPAS